MQREVERLGQSVSRIEREQADHRTVILHTAGTVRPLEERCASTIRVKLAADMAAIDKVRSAAYAQKGQANRLDRRMHAATVKALHQTLRNYGQLEQIDAKGFGRAIKRVFVLGPPRPPPEGRHWVYKVVWEEGYASLREQLESADLPAEKVVVEGWQGRESQAERRLRRRGNGQQQQHKQRGTASPGGRRSTIYPGGPAWPIGQSA